MATLPVAALSAATTTRSTLSSLAKPPLCCRSDSTVLTCRYVVPKVVRSLRNPEALELPNYEKTDLAGTRARSTRQARLQFRHFLPHRSRYPRRSSHHSTRPTGSRCESETGEIGFKSGSTTPTLSTTPNPTTSCLSDQRTAKVGSFARTTVGLPCERNEDIGAGTLIAKVRET